MRGGVRGAKLDAAVAANVKELGVWPMSGRLLNSVTSLTS